ncbi:pyocin activator PrtN family protein [Pseudomonas alliivorans]|nr:pyocin activator PrtN family protein [Pseudomonas alliivorans]MEE4834251.1 pyocin activator PrtN family protein [Pseudomonas alliivorans]MEE4924695.1 pyocin activator PrtN family protein [Pseudomonas alliivorans]
MNTAFLLMAQYNAQVIISLDRVCADYFSHLTTERLRMKIESGEIDLPLLKMDGGRKPVFGIHLMDLASHIDSLRENAKQGHAQFIHSTARRPEVAVVNENEKLTAPTARPESPSDFIKLPEVKRLTALSGTVIYKRISSGVFPRQVSLGGKAVAWVRGEILEWCRQRVDEARRSDH